MSLLWAVAAERLSCRTCYLGVCSLMAFCVVLVALLHQEWQYWLLVLLLCVTGTGGFALGRSLLASLVPKEKSAEVFGFASFAGQVSGFLGPLLFSLIAQISGIARLGFVLVFVSLVSGIYLFQKIEFPEVEKVQEKVAPDQPTKKGYGAVGSEESPWIEHSEDSTTTLEKDGYVVQNVW